MPATFQPMGTSGQIIGPDDSPNEKVKETYISVVTPEVNNHSYRKKRKKREKTLTPIPAPNTILSVQPPSSHGSFMHSTYNPSALVPGKKDL